MGKAETPVLTKTVVTGRWTLGVTGATRKGSRMERAREALTEVPSLSGQPMGIRKRNLIGSVRESELPIVYR